MLKYLFLICAICAGVANLEAATRPRLEDVAGKLSCYCGTCPHLLVTKCGCSTADQIKTDVQKMIDEGKTEKEILDFYVAQYGETVLSAPPKKGFGLAAWALPFLAFAAGGFFLFTFLKQQQKASPPPRAGEIPEAAAVSSEEDARYRKMLKQELDLRK